MCGNFGFLLKNACSEIKIASLIKSKCKIWKADITHHIFTFAERKDPWNIFQEYYDYCHFRQQWLLLI